MNNHMKKWRTYLIYFVFLLSIVLFTLYKFEKREDELSKEYILITKKDSLNDIIVFKYNEKVFKYSSFFIMFTLSSGEKRSLNTHLNLEYEESFYGINDVAQEGDRILKKANNDTIMIRKKNNGSDKIFYYLIDER